MTANIRPAVKADIADLIVVIDELNVHEDEPTGHMTPEKAARDLMGPDAALGAFVAEAEGVLISFSFWHSAYETCYAAWGGFINDLYVRATHRGTGAGRALVQAVARAVAEEGGEFVWLTGYSHNDIARRFYKRLMDEEEERVVAYALTGDRFKALVAGEI